tara:strand:- start:121 stop:945 length:825 start_codon:yes stop_codon:yes gene_type:complete
MISRRLTKTQKAEILEAYRAGNNSNALAEKYGCTTNTINRTVKTLLSDSEYSDLKELRSKISNKKSELISNKTKKEISKNLEHSKTLIPFKEKSKQEDQNLEIIEDAFLSELEEIPFLALDDADDFNDEIASESQNHKKYGLDTNSLDLDNKLEEIEPLVSSFDFDIEQQKTDFEMLNYESLPDSVYMIVDKKVELELQPISDLPEWNFLPENELERNAILLFSNQRSAKRTCSRNQRVIKIPNTNIFKLSKPYLVSKGITRLIIEDSIIALDD